MKRLILQSILIVFAVKVSAQTTNVDTGLKFNNLIIFCEKQWVVMPKPDTTTSYTFGYVYIDGVQGIMFQKKGIFTINNKGRYVGNRTNAEKNFPPMLLHYNGSVVKLPLRVAILPVLHFKELKIKAEPDWIKPYYTYTDTLEHNYRWGCIYIDELIVSIGIGYLEKVYKTSPHYAGVKVNMDKYDFFFNLRGVELKLASAYYRMGQFDKSINILNAAILYNPGNVNFYMQLGLIYWDKKELTKGIEIFKQGIALIPDEKSSQKYWFAGCISNMYGELKNDQEKVKWRALSDSYNPRPGVVY